MSTAFLSAKDAKNAKEAKIADGRLDCVALAAPVIFLPLFFASFADKCSFFQLLATCSVTGAPPSALLR
jgi:hypothetical protein